MSELDNSPKLAWGTYNHHAFILHRILWYKLRYWASHLFHDEGIFSSQDWRRESWNPLSWYPSWLPTVWTCQDFITSCICPCPSCQTFLTKQMKTGQFIRFLEELQTDSTLVVWVYFFCYWTCHQIYHNGGNSSWWSK